jgi:hypothetical protein
MMQAAGKTLRTIYWIAEASYKTGIIYEIQRRRIQFVVSCDNRMQMIHSPMQWEGETHPCTHTQRSNNGFLQGWSFLQNISSQLLDQPSSSTTFFPAWFAGHVTLLLYVAASCLMPSSVIPTCLPPALLIPFLLGLASISLSLSNP